MSQQHNRWLAWKIKHGLARHGRAAGPMNPTGWIAKFLYSIYFRKLNQAEEQGQRTFTQDVGGTLGAVGRMNGE